MAVAESGRKLTPTQRQFVEQARTRMKDLNGMEKDIRTRMRVCSDERCMELEEWFETLESLKSQAAVEIEMIEYATENEWAERRQRVDQFLGEAEREFETGYEILERPEEPAHKRIW